MTLYVDKNLKYKRVRRMSECELMPYVLSRLHLLCPDWILLTESA